MKKGVFHALAAALLFGASTPLAKLLVGQMPPVMLAGLLYLGSGIGLSLWFLLRQAGSDGDTAKLHTKDLPWLGGAIALGGVVGPVLLMIGLSYTQASTASLMLNLEGVLTAALAWFVFKENFDRRIFIGMVLIVIAGVLLTWDQRAQFGFSIGAVAIAGACLCWAIDNNLTRKVSAVDAVQIAAIKGMVAGFVNLALAIGLGASMPAPSTALLTGLIGLGGYGISLVMFVLALRHLGAARTGAYFSIAPFAGAAISLVLLAERPDLLFWVAAVLMGIGMWLHLTEHHGHAHVHDPLSHTHEHTHDDHHQHQHESGWDGMSPHSHPHRHEFLAHTHAHFPDIHHQHRH